MLHGGEAAVQQNTTLFFPLFPGAGLTPEFFNTLLVGDVAPTVEAKKDVELPLLDTFSTPILKACGRQVGAYPFKGERGSNLS